MEGNEAPELSDHIGILLNELEAYKKSVAELTNKLNALVDENLRLRSQLTNSLTTRGAADQLSSPPLRRKQAKNSNQDVSSQISSDGAGPTAQNLSHQNTNATTSLNGFVPVTSRKNSNNRKKIIQTLDADIKVVRSAIKNANCKGFTLKQSSVSAPIKISVEAHDEIPAVRNALINNNISFHEFKWANEKQQAFVIRGLVGVADDDLPIIFEDLLRAGIPSDAKLSRLITGHMKANTEMRHNTLLKLVVPPEFDSQLLLQIKYIDHVAVSFEKLKSKHIVQCKNCQRFGHSAGGCQHKHRCVKCGENHLRENCPRTYNKAVKLVCCNCNGEHSANNLPACSYFQQHYKQAAATTKPTSKTTVDRIGASKPTSEAKVHPMRSYAAVAQGGGYTSAAPVPGSQNTPLNIADIAKKLDFIVEMVTKHEELLQNIFNNE